MDLPELRKTVKMEIDDETKTVDREGDVVDLMEQCDKTCKIKIIPRRKDIVDAYYVTRGNKFNVENCYKQFIPFSFQHYMDLEIPCNELRKL